MTVIGKSDQPAPRLRVMVTGPLPPPVGGISTFCRDLLASSLVEKAEVRFFQSSPPGRQLSETDLSRPRLRNMVDAVGSILAFTRQAISFCPQVTHITTAAGLSFLKNSLIVLIARLLGSKVLIHVRQELAVFYTSQSTWRRWYIRKIIQACNGMLAISQEWLAFQEIVPSTKVYWLPNAINLKPYREIAGRRVGQSEKNPLHVLYLGYIGEAKGSLDLVEAARIALANRSDRDPQVIFELVGPELQQGAIEETRQRIEGYQIGSHVQIHPPVDGEEKEATYARADIFVLPSHSEGLPITIIEAMACGLPVVGTRVGGIPDLITDGVNGLLVEKEQPDQLAESILQLCFDGALRTRMGEQGCARACQNHDMEGYVDRLLEIYHEVVGGGKELPVLKVLLTGVLPPPLGGISTFCESVLNSSLVKRAEVRFVRTSPVGRPLSETSLTRPRLRNILAALRSIALFYREARAFRPQVTHISTAAGLSFLKNSVLVIIARWLGSKALVHIHDSLGFFYANQPAWQQWYIRQIIKLCSGLLVVSQEWLAFQQVIPGTPIFYMPYSIDLEPYRKIAQSRFHSASRPALHILYLGYIGKPKGSMDLIEAARILSSCLEKNERNRVFMELIGPELYPGAIQAVGDLIRHHQLDGWVLIGSPVVGVAKEEAYARADFFVCPSHHEGMPLTIIEAMASGLPIVGTRVGGIPDLVMDGLNGLLVEREHPAELADRLLRLCRDEGLRARMGQECYDRACQNHDMEKYAGRLLQVYQQVV